MDFYGINLTNDVTAEGTPDLATVGNPMGTMYGEATSAQWGDLAEKYTCKGECDKGTVMSVSSDVEVDAEPCSTDLCPAVIGVISFQPGFQMNESLWNGKFIGLTGRLPVRIVGGIKKGNFIVATKDGCARAGKSHEIAHKIGVANESNPDTEIKLVECVIK
jgi:hypothetical protein